MSERTSRCVLVVANRTAPMPALIEAVRERARRGPCTFAVLVPQLVAEELFGEWEALKTLQLARPDRGDVERERAGRADVRLPEPAEEDAQHRVGVGRGAVGWTPSAPGRR